MLKHTAYNKQNDTSMNSHALGFTPVRRREDTVNMHHHETKNTKIWTATRCHRLLRPIRSRIESMKRDANRLQHARAASTETPDIDIVDGLVEEAGWSQLSEEASSGSDHEWGRSRKRLRKTYGAKTFRGRVQNHAAAPKASASQSGQEQKALRYSRPGEIAVPTPIIARLRNFDDQAPLRQSEDAEPKQEKWRRPHPRFLTKDGNAHFKLAETRRELRKTIDPTRFTLYEGVYNALETLLRATSPTPDSLKGGAKSRRSLFSMCLKNVPQTIQLEEQRLQDHAEEYGINGLSDMPDISAEIYDELEGLGTGSSGWKHLKAVVRSHGVRCISDAIAEGYIEARFAGTLVMLCVHLASNVEAERLLAALLTARAFPAAESVSSTYAADLSHQPLVVLEEYTQYTGRLAFHHRQMAILFDEGRLPVMWAVTNQFKFTWVSAFQELARDIPSVAAAAMLENVLPLLAVQDSYAKNSSRLQSLVGICLESILLKLVATSLLTEKIHIQRGILQILKSVTIHHENHDPTRCHRSRFLLAAASLLISPVESSTVGKDLLIVQHALTTLVEYSNPLSSDSSNELPLFICSIARCRGRALGNNGFDSLKSSLDRMEGHASNFAYLSRGSINRILVDTAYTFAEVSPHWTHLEYAADLSTELHGQHDHSRAVSGSCVKETESSFRWEEGISEWILMTPLSKQLQKPRVNLLTVDNIEVVTPLQKRRHTEFSHASTKEDDQVDELCNGPLRLSDLVPDTPAAVMSSSPATVIHSIMKIKAAPRLTWQPLTYNLVQPMHEMDVLQPFQAVCYDSGSDDELSFVDERLVFKELANVNGQRKPKRKSTGNKIHEGRLSSLVEDSEDELSIF